MQQQNLQIVVPSGTLNWRATVKILNGVGWVIAVPPSGTATPSLPSTVRLDVDFGAFSEPGTYQAEVLIEEDGVLSTTRGPAERADALAGGVLARLPVLVVVRQAGPLLQLSQSAMVFRTIVGGSAAAQTLRILNGGQGSMNWTIPVPATLTPPANWLGISSLSGSSVTGGSESSTTLSVNTAGLSEGVYQTLVPVSAPGAANNPQIVAVTLHVAPASTPASPEFSFSGILFAVPEGATEAPVFNLRLENTGGGSATFALELIIESGGTWLTVSPSTGSVGATPTNILVGLNLGGLTAQTTSSEIGGIFRAVIRASILGRIFEILVVLSRGVPTIQNNSPFRDLPVAALCAATSMEMVVDSIGTGSIVPVSFPRPLLATMVDSCGNPLNNATVTATIQGRIIPLAPLGDGVYSGMWVPESDAASLDIAFVALHPSYPRVDRTVTVSTAPAAGGISLPVLFSDGVVEGAAFTSRRPLAPGGIVSLFGSQFAAADAGSPGLPLERSLGGVIVRIGGEDAPLYFAGPGQINAQVPYSVQLGNDVPVVVRVSGQLTAPQTYLVASAQPGIFLAGEGGAILDAQSQLVNASNPAQRGTVLQIFATGLGQTDPPAESGQGAPAFSQVLVTVTVTIGGVEAPVQYQGLAPGFVGLYQVNVLLPTTVEPGDSVEVVIRQNGVPSNPDRPATIPVQ